MALLLTSHGYDMIERVYFYGGGGIHICGGALKLKRHYFGEMICGRFLFP